MGERKLSGAIGGGLCTWRVIVRLRREGSDAYLDTAFDITLESGEIVFQQA